MDHAASNRRVPTAGPTSGEVLLDRYDVLGFQAEVSTWTNSSRAVVRTILQGFGPVGAGTVRATSSFRLEPQPNGHWQVATRHGIVHSGADLVAAAAALEWEIISAALEARRDLFHLHGSALCLPAARAGLVLVGGSGRGKTTLTLGLMQRGFVPFADDVALLDMETLELTALRRAFHVEDRSWQLLEPLAGVLSRDEDRLPGYFSPPQWAEHPVPVRWLLCPEFRPGQAVALVPMTPSEAASAIVDHTTSLARTPRTALSTAAKLTARARCYRFRCGDLGDAVAAIQKLVGGAAASPTPVRHG